jgi:hypothetical protein
MKTRKTAMYRQPKLQFDPAKYETKQVFYTSRDGTRVPMFLRENDYFWAAARACGGTRTPVTEEEQRPFWDRARETEKGGLSHGPFRPEGEF